MWFSGRVATLARKSEQATDLSYLDDETLMAQVANGNHLALECLYGRYGRTVYGLALRMLASADLAEDVVQEAFWRVWRRGSTYSARSGQFTAWLFGITHNLCIDELRRQRSRPTPVYGSAENEFAASLPDEQIDIEGQTLQGERRRVISEALRDLPPDQRVVIELAYFSGLSQREIAERLNDPLGTVKTRIRLGLQKLKQVLHVQGIGHEDR